jgi:hypothetical protein
MNGECKKIMMGSGGSAVFIRFAGGMMACEYPLRKNKKTNYMMTTIAGEVVDVN